MKGFWDVLGWARGSFLVVRVAKLGLSVSNRGVFAVVSSIILERHCQLRRLTWQETRISYCSLFK